MGRAEDIYKEGERLLTEKEVAEWLNVPLSTIRTLRYKETKKGPPHTKVGGSVRYSPTAVRQYLQSNTKDPSEKFIFEVERRASKRSA